jgi:small-conductance mechanosensitive channel
LTNVCAQFIKNIRRSPQMSEPFVFSVAYETTFEQIEQLRKKMLDFVSENARDYQPSFDIVVSGTSARCTLLVLPPRAKRVLTLAKIFPSKRK